MSLILPNLYLGSLKVASDEQFLKSHKIKHILSVGQFSQFKLKAGVVKRHKMLKVKDNSSEPISEYFWLASEFINEALNNEEGVIVHCLKGMSRSPTIVVSFLMIC